MLKVEHNQENLHFTPPLALKVMKANNETFMLDSYTVKKIP